ncbi:MAG: hypothetical protein J6Y72_03925 [Bacteroidales bacterium]|nr:hypothetical protein [Bacteroidales bacterium]
MRNKIDDVKTIDLCPSTSSVLSFHILTDKTLIFHPQTGAEISTKIKFFNTTSNNSSYAISFRPRYSFIKRAFQPILSVSTNRIYTSVGREFMDYNNKNAVSFWPNTTSALLAHRNHKSLYDRRFAYFDIFYDINDIDFQLSLEYYEARPLKQVSDFSILYPKRNYKLIAPDCARYIPTDSTRSYRNQANVQFEVNKYGLFDKSIYAGLRINQGLGITKQSGVFTQLTAEVSQTIGGYDGDNALVELLFGPSDLFMWTCRLGYMKSRSEKVKFADWMHQESANRLCGISDENGFQGFLTYSPYEMSTDKWFASCDVRLRRSLLLTQMELMQLLGYTEELYLRHACIEGHDNYSEIGYALVSRSIIRYGVFIALRDFDYRGVYFRLGVDL